MKKKALAQDFIIEIKKSMNRFASILLIVALGVAFFAGIRATEPDMQISADRFYDDSNLMDIRLLSTMGLTEEDVAAISQVEGVKEVEPSYSVDVLSDTKDMEMVVKVLSKTEKLNQTTIVEGRLPQDITECLVDQQFIEFTGYKVGDTIKLRSGTEEDISESLQLSEYTIVGVGTSAYYLSLERGSSSIGNGKINSFIVVSPETFKIEAYTEIYVTVKEAKELTSYTAQYDDTVEAVLDNIEAIADVRREARYQQVLEEPQSEVAKAKTELAEKEAEANEELTEAAVQIEDAKIKLADAEVTLNDAKEELNHGKKEIEENKKKLIASEVDIKNGKEEINAAKTQIENGMQLLQDKQKELQIGEDTLASEYVKWNESMSQWTAMNQQLEENENSPTTTNTELLQQKEQLDGAKIILDQEQEKLNVSKALLTEEIQKIEVTEATITKKSKELEAGQKKIEDGWKEIELAEADIQEADSILTSNQSELDASQKTLEEKDLEYKDAVLLAEEKIADGKQQIDDAEEKINEIEYPKWYVLDRNSIQTYVEYGQDSTRIGNIGKIFPLIFFLVAALVSLTTMTRMVEEQRTQIGTYKALGYSKKSIAGKYILYAFLASFIGSIVGVVIGEKLLPQVIITAYTILYNNLPRAITPINMYYGVMSTLIAVLCTTLASLFACYKELMAPPAELMRPASPKFGKRVVLERIPWLWKRLNFTQKSTIRNLFRYKKRFFMTVFGIGGCMALLLVGFGIKDSIAAMSDIQYVDLWKQDSIVTINDKSSNQEIEDLFRVISTDTQIKDTISVKETTVDVGHGKVTKNTTLIVPEDVEQLENYIVFRDRVTHEVKDLQENSVIITEKLALLLGVSVGDTIFLKDSDANSIEVALSGIIENYMMHYIFMSPKTYENLYGETPEYNKIYTRNQDNQEAGQKELAAELLKLPSVTSISFTSELQERIEDMLTSLNLVVYVLIISAGLLAFVVLYNLNNININERKRELATLKVLGFQDIEVASYVYRENIMLTIIGTGTGVFLGILLHRFVIITAEIDAIMFGRNINGISYLFSMLLTFGFSFFVNYVMYYKLRKIDMVESLKSVE